MLLNMLAEGDFVVMQTISQVSKAYDISTRMLRYYEQVGLDPEEIINYYDIYHNNETERQYDVLFPVKRYQEIMIHLSKSLIT